VNWNQNQQSKKELIVKASDWFRVTGPLMTGS